MTTGFLFLALLVLLLIGAPIGIALGLASVATMLLFGDESPAAMALALYETLQRQSLLAIPFLILAAALLSSGGVALRILRLALACVGHLRGGAAMASALACMLFAALTGSSPVAVVAVGAIVAAGMVQAGYPERLAAGVIGSAATIGPLVPPAIVVLVYAAVSGVDVGRMFLAGIVPAIAAALVMMAAIAIVARVGGLPRQPRASLGETVASARAALWDLLPIAIVIGTICGGLLSAPEAAAVVAAYAFVVALAVDRDVGPLKDRAPYRPVWADRQPIKIRLIARPLVALVNLAVGLATLPVAALHRDLRAVLVEAARTTIALLFVFINAALFADVLASQQVPQAILRAVDGAGLESWVLLPGAGVILLLAGQLMEPAALVMVAAPTLFPIATTLGLDPVHLGALIVMTVEIALMAPPAGLSLFMAGAITGLGGAAATRAALPWLAILLLLLAALALVPQIATFLPDLIYGPQAR